MTLSIMLLDTFSAGEYPVGSKEQRGHKGVSSQSQPLTGILKLFWEERKRGPATAGGTQRAELKRSGEGASSVWLEERVEKAMAPHSSTLAWKVPWAEEPGGLQSVGSRRVGHDWATSLSLFTFMHWRRKWQPTPVFLPGESQGRGSLVGCRLRGRTESDTTGATQQQQQH